LNINYFVFIAGLKNAAELALPNSLAYLFSDASAKDYQLYDTVLPIILQKQIKVNFLVTGTCSKPKDQNDVYHKIAFASQGQVFNITHNNVNDILRNLSHSFEPNFQTLASFEFDKGDEKEIPINVDASFSELTVSVSGINSKVSIKNHNNESVATRDGFTSDNVKFVTFPVNDSKYHLIASADSAFSIRVGGESELKFEYGFSLAIPHEHTETSNTPLLGRKNVLSVFVSDHTLIKCLTRATLTVANDKVEITFMRNKLDIFSTGPVEIPSKMFRIDIFGH
jgi:hemicentin